MLIIFSQFGVPENIGSPPNSKYSEGAPFISADGKTIYFTSDRPGGIGFEDIWFSKLVDGKWSKPVNLGKPINTPTSDGIFCLTSDELTLYFASFRKPSVGNSDIFVSYKRESGWTEPQNLGKPLNSKYWDSYPTISPDGKVLFFVSSRPNGVGGTDIWYSVKKKNGEWSYPRNPGPPLNSEYDELAPFLHPDGKTLFFSSNRPGGLGKFDIYKTVINWEDTSFSEPVNLGSPVNSKDNDVGFSIPASGDYGYFTRSIRKEGQNAHLDIFRVLLPEEIRPVKPVTMVKGVVRDKETGKPVVGAKVIIENLETGEVFTETYTDSVGEYKIALPSGFHYGVTVTAEDYLFSSENLDLKSQKVYKEISTISELAPIKKGEKIQLKNIFFDFNKATLRPESKLELDRVVKIMLEHPELMVEIAGHTDDIGDEEYNMKLSWERAKAVVDYLVKHGVPAERLVPKGYGETQPLVPNVDEESRQLNRRVEFKILSGGE